ncbi:MAG: lactate racemase domain-containing protein [Pseudomonadota bacterium]
MKGETIDLAYGPRPLTIPRYPNVVQVLERNFMEGVKDLGEELRRALREPIGSTRLRNMAGGGDTVTLMISDAARIYPRREMVEAVREEISHIPDSSITIVIATGNHAAGDPEELGLGEDILKRYRIINHNSRNFLNMQYMGLTPARERWYFAKSAAVEFLKAAAERAKRLSFIHGDSGRSGTITFKTASMGLVASLQTPVFINRIVAKSDVKIGLGQIKPHYFAGYAGGAKSYLPGISWITTIGINHFMKTHPRSRLGIIKGNHVRADMEAAVRLCGRTFILNIVKNGEGDVVRAVAGDVVEAHRAGVDVCKKISIVKARKTEVVIASFKRPASMNIYQMTKAVATALKAVKDGGVIICAGDCSEGTGSLRIINEVIFNLGMSRYLPPGTDVLLVSDLPAEEVNKTFFRYVESVDKGIEFAGRKLKSDFSITVIPNADMLIPVTEDDDPDGW